MVSTSVARAEPSDSMGSRPRVTKHCRAGASPEQDQVRLSVVSTGTATVSTCAAWLYLLLSLLLTHCSPWRSPASSSRVTGAACMRIRQQEVGHVAASRGCLGTEGGVGLAFLRHLDTRPMAPADSCRYQQAQLHAGKHPTDPAINALTGVPGYRGRSEAFPTAPEHPTHGTHRQLQVPAAQLHVSAAVQLAKAPGSTLHTGAQTRAPMLSPVCSACTWRPVARWTLRG